MIALGVEVSIARMCHAWIMVCPHIVMHVCSLFGSNSPRSPTERLDSICPSTMAPKRRAPQKHVVEEPKKKRSKPQEQVDAQLGNFGLSNYDDARAELNKLLDEKKTSFSMSSHS